MPEVTAQPELTQVLTILQAMQTSINTMQSDIQSIRQDVQTLDKKLDVYIACTDERLKSIDLRFDSLEEKISIKFRSLEEKMEIKFQALDEKVDDLKQEVLDLRIQQRTTDNRMLGFVFTALVAALGLLTKVIFFTDKA